ncbi:MAG: hypothetical protein JW774_05595 [Candidatus Aureabacteria bacterium]|nr:hypothetical protein [Candidatus Auribacterota bacterium]
MKNIIHLGITMWLLLLTAVQAVEETTLTPKGKLSFVNKFVWRGFNLNDNWNIQPEFSIEMAGITLGYWGSYHWESDESYYNEHDIYIGYEWAYPDTVLNFKVGYNYYKFPLLLEDNETHELWFGADLDILFKPSLILFVDVVDKDKGGGDGEYLIASISHEWKLVDEVAVMLDTTLGYNYKQYIDENGFADLVPSVTVSWALYEHFIIEAKLSYSYLLDKDIQEAMNSDNEFIAMFSVKMV